MPSDEPVQNKRSYGCTFSCGNPYDYVVIDVQGGDTQFLCVPCFVKIAADMVAVITDPDSPEAALAMSVMMEEAGELVPGPSGKPRGHNAPVTNTDPGIFEAFDGSVPVDDDPGEWR